MRLRAAAIANVLKTLYRRIIEYAHDKVKQLKHTPPHIHFKCKYFKWNNMEIFIISRKICNYVL